MDWVIVASLLTGVGTLVLAVATIIQSCQTRAQLELGKRQAETARDQFELAQNSANTAVQVHQEAIRSRVDQNAPRLVVSLSAVKPPLIDNFRTGMPHANELRLLSDESLVHSEPADGHTFDFDQDRSIFLWFRGYGLLTNEGPTTVRIRPPSESRFVEGRSNLAGGKFVQLPNVEPGLFGLALVPPGDSVLFEWAAGHTVGEWVDASVETRFNHPGGSIWLWAVAFDSREFGAIDTHMMHFRLNMLYPVHGKNSTWQVEYSGNEEVVVLPTRRGYRHEGDETEDVSQMHDFHRRVNEGEALQS